jgi:putative glutamine amidotransferase
VQFFRHHTVLSEQNDMRTRAIIGIHAGGVFGPSQHVPEIDRLLTRWIGCTAGAGAIPVVVPGLSSDKGLDELLDAVQGFVIAGERDAGDACLDGPDCPAWEPLSEFRLVRAIAQRRVPVLGIGLGFQLLNLVLGGTIRPLEQDVRGQPFHAYPHNPRHPVDPVPGSLMHNFFGSRAMTVNSSHRCAIDRLGEGLTASAVSSDGVVEAFESTSGDWFALGVQFQPDESCDVDLAAVLFDALVEESLAQTSPAWGHQPAGQGDRSRLSC